MYVLAEFSKKGIGIGGGGVVENPVAMEQHY